MAGQVQMKFRTWGGKRRGAGRPAKRERPSERHQRRPVVRADRPVHVVLRAANDLGTLRTTQMYRAIREATLSVASRHDDVHVTHASIQRTHLHLIVEARDARVLAKAMQGFAGGLARRINRLLGRRGAVFPDHYHLRILKTPTQVRNAISYVLNNWRHHGEHRGCSALVDPFSSGLGFRGWAELEGRDVRLDFDERHALLWTWLPRSWLLREGWRRAGPISAREVPGAMRN